MQGSAAGHPDSRAERDGSREMVPNPFLDATDACNEDDQRRYAVAGPCADDTLMPGGPDMAEAAGGLAAFDLQSLARGHQDVPHEYPVCNILCHIT